MSLFKAMATVGGFTGLSRIAGFIRDILTAAILGAGPVADAFFVALKLPNFFRRVTAEGAFSVSFVPLYSEALEKDGAQEADAFASNAFAAMLWFLTLFTVLALIAMPWIIYAIAPGFSDDPERYDLAVELSRITFPYLLLMSLTALLGGVLNAHGRFAPFAAAPILFNLALIAALLLSDAFFETAGHALAWGVFVAGFLQLGLLLFYVRRAKIRLRLVRPRMTDRTKRLLLLMGPGVIGAGVMHINLFVDLIIASFLPQGSISYLYYADRLNQLPLGVVGIAVGTALLPMLSRALSAGQNGQAQHLFNRALEISLLLSLPAAAALAVIPEALISILFERGAFTAEDTAVTAMVLRGYALGLPAYVAVKVFSSAYWSRQDTISPVKVAVKTTLLNILLALVLIQFLGVVGIALATGLAGWYQFFALRRGLSGLDAARFDGRFKRALPRIVAATGLMAAAVYILARFLGGWVTAGAMLEIAALILLVGGGMAVYGLAVWMTGAVPVQDIKKYLFKRGQA